MQCHVMHPGAKEALLKESLLRLTNLSCAKLARGGISEQGTLYNWRKQPRPRSAVPEIQS